MILKAGRGNQIVPLKPFVFKLREGFLVGLARDPDEGSPCANCVERWLIDRRVFIEKAELSDLRTREPLAELLAENTPHILYELPPQGDPVRLECVVFPHPRCECNRKHYLAPVRIAKKTNFAFSPIIQLKCARYGTPSGNLWLTSAAGRAPFSDRLITAFGAARDREAARMQAVECWLEKSSLVDLPVRLNGGESFAARNVVGDTGEIVAELPATAFDAFGAAHSLEEANQKACLALVKLSILKSYSSTGKNPMLVVGANSWLRSRLPFFLLQEYDLYPLFYPNSSPAWIVGIAALSRLRTDQRPVFVFGANGDVTKAFDEAIFRLLEHCRPVEWISDELRNMKERDPQKASKLNLWWTHWIYRCPKISLRDVLHLEPHASAPENWQQYYSEIGAKVTLGSVNCDFLPTAFRHIVRATVVSAAQAPEVININGIGTWKDFRESLLTS
ncbi:MAG: hypothetical protein HY537_02355 [Deltaproteobacteria bacterium]|nr:hypothetical protein [Deltaproteobacteria bacterium]